MQVPVYSLAGQETSQIEIRDDVFAVPFNEAVVHQAMVRQQANARQGTASTKARGDLTYSTRKLFRQKHTGLARAGSRRSPIRRGGGVVFGPKPRSYRQQMPKKMRRLALRCVLSDKAGSGTLKVIEDFQFDGPKTAEMVKILAALETAPSVLVVTGEPEINVIKSASNVAGAKTLPAALLNVGDILAHRTLLMTTAAVRKAEELWGQPESQGEADEPV